MKIKNTSKVLSSDTEDPSDITVAEVSDSIIQFGNKVDLESKLGIEGEDSSIEMAALAASQCIEKSGVDEMEIGLFINVGTWADKNIVEPAVASIMQKKAGLGLKPGKEEMEKGKGTLSFDILHGPIGFFHALNVIRGFMEAGTTNNAIIVSGNAHPSTINVPEFPYTPSGAAMLLEQSNQENGFKNFMFKTSEGEYVGKNQCVDLTAHGGNSRNVATVETEDDYEDRLKDFAVGCLEEYVEEDRVDLSKVKHVITSTQSSTIGGEIIDELGLEQDTLVDIYDDFGDTHTSTHIIGYNFAAKNRSLKEDEQILFIGFGSGLSFACALYEI